MITHPTVKVRPWKEAGNLIVVAGIKEKNQFRLLVYFSSPAVKVIYKTEFILS